LGADLVPGGYVVLVLVCELVDLVSQLLHRARSEATAKGAEALEVVHALAIALDSDAGGVWTAGEKEGNLRPHQAGLWPQSPGMRAIIGP
jgi:mannose/cellobiose epimerase-like protein (N-acyl-D-glucosamine 2-epimerase family)